MLSAPVSQLFPFSTNSAKPGPMPAVVTRRSRLYHAAEFNNFQLAPVQTPIERVQHLTSETTSCFESKVAKHQWQEDKSLGNIRLTPFGPERTGYTYGDSGSYRVDQIREEWNSPNMSRLPLRQLTEQQQEEPSIALLSHQKTTSVEMTGSRDRGKAKIDVPSSTIDRENRDEVENDEKTSSRQSTVSSNSSTHSLRSRCKEVQGQWCTHTECVISGNTARRQSFGRQRNTNNTTNTLTEEAENDASTQGTRTRGARRSTRTTTKSTLNVTQTIQPDPIVNHPVERFGHLGTSSSTYVYHYVPHVDSADAGLNLTMQPPVSGDGPCRTGLIHGNGESWTKRLSAVWSRPTGAEPAEAADTTYRYQELSKNTPTGSHGRNWLARHIFGLEKGKQNQGDDCTPKYFVSSDAEDDEASMVEPLPAHRCVRRVGADQLELPFRQRPSHMRVLCSCGSRGLQLIRRGAIESLALILAVFYALTNLVVGAFSLVLNLFQRATSKLLTPEYLGYPLEKPIHPRLAHFREDSNSYVNLSTLKQSSFTRRLGLAIWFGLRGFLRHCCRLLGFLCFLIPLLLLLAFLFAPVAIDDDATSTMRRAFLSDAECNRSVEDALPSGANAWQTAQWRFRCLYHRYILTPMEPSRNQTDTVGSLSAFWIALLRWWTQEPTTESRVPPLPKFSVNGVSESKLLEQLTEFSQVVYHRLDVLSENLRSTNARVSDIAAQSTIKSDAFNNRLTELQEQLKTYAEALEYWQLEWKSHEALFKLARTETGESVSKTEAESLLRSAMDIMNQTVVMQFDALRAELRADQSGYWTQYEGRLSKLSLLLANLQFQLTYRIRQTERELAQLRLQLRNRLEKQTSDNLNLSTTVNQLRRSIHNLEARHSDLEKARLEAEAITQATQEAVQRCHDRQAQNTQECRQAALEQVNNGIDKLTIQLTDQISTLVEEAIRKHVLFNLPESQFHDRVNQMVTQIAREFLEKTLTDKAYIGFNNAQHLMNVSDIHAIQSLIDVALQRFAADRIGMADFALESAGGAVVGTRCTRTYTEGSALFSIFGIPLARLSNSPRTILQPGNNPGDCWPFHGSTGQAVIRLSAPVIISAVSLEHLPRSLAPNERLDSAPKDFVIKGLKSEDDEEGVVLGNFTYDIKGPPIQTFTIHNQSEPRQYIEFAVVSNHGHPLYTCVYRLRVHGTMPE